MKNPKQWRSVWAKVAETLAESDLFERANPDGSSEPAPESATRHMTIQQMLTAQQIQRVIDLWNTAQNPDDGLKKLKAYFQSIKPDLDAKGLVPDYLAYMLYAKLTGIT